MREQSRVPLLLTRPLFLLRGSMKATITMLMLAAALAACKTAPICPAGTRQVGEGPPKDSEIACEKNVNGQYVKEGPFVIYRDDGSKMLEGQYHDGKQSGEWTQLCDSGQKASVDHYKDGVQDGEHVGWYQRQNIRDRN